MKKPISQRRALRKLVSSLDITQEDFGKKIIFLQSLLEKKTEDQLKRIITNSAGKPSISPIRY